MKLLLDSEIPPQHIVEAANTVAIWMAQNNHDYWQLGGCCDRKFAFDYAREQIVSAATAGKLPII